MPIHGAQTEDSLEHAVLKTLTAYLALGKHRTRVLGVTQVLTIVTHHGW